MYLFIFISNFRKLTPSNEHKSSGSDFDLVVYCIIKELKLSGSGLVRADQNASCDCPTSFIGLSHEN